LDSLRDEHRKRNSLNRETAGQTNEVKPRGDVQRSEPSPALDKGTSNGESERVWERMWERQNLLTALTRVETNGGAPGIDARSVTVQELRPYLKEQWLDTLRGKRPDAGTYQVRCVGWRYQNLTAG